MAFPEVDGQTIWSGVISAILFVFGGMLSWLRDTSRDANKERESLRDRLTALELLVSGQYAKRSEIEAMFQRLDAISNKLDAKMDRADFRALILERRKAAADD